jgi:signal transduction histidine kinase
VAMAPKKKRPERPPRDLLVRGDRISRKSWLLWAVTSMVLVGLTAAVALLYMPMVRAASEEFSPEIFTRTYYSIVGLAGLVLVFCLFTALRHRDLENMRRRIAREELETEDLRTRLSELSALFQVSTTLNLHLGLDMILEIIVRRVVAAFKAQHASIMLYNPGSGVLETRASYGLESEFARHARKRLGEGIAGWVAQQQQPVLLDHQTSGDLNRHFKRDRNITSALSLPLRVGERCVGVLNVNRINHPDPFEDRHRDVLALFAEHVGAVIERAETLDRLGSRSRELEAVNRQLAETNRMKDLFLSTASHELKTPLTSVIAYAELLDENQDRLSRPQRSEFLNRLRGEATRLLGLIEDILDLTRIESGKLTLKPAHVAVSEIAHGAVETSRTLAEKHQVRLVERYEENLPQLHVDEVKLRQAVVNLIVNAVKFSPERGEVAISVEREPRWVRIEVSDHGPGVPPDETTHIFELFGQGVDVQSNQPQAGVGIGLHLVKRITELHGGHVGVNSATGEGSRFWIRLPISLSDSAEPEGTESPESTEAQAA